MHFLNYEMQECRSDIPLYRHSRWAMPDYTHLRELMREAFENRNRWKAEALEGSEIVRAKYTWRALGERIRERIAAVD